MGRISEQEQDAIDAWLSKNRPIQYPTGHSSLYDEFGNRRTTVRFRLAGVAKKVRAISGYGAMNADEIGKRIAETPDTVRAACKKHRIKIK